MSSISYNRDSNLFVRFRDHANLAFSAKQDIPPHTESKLEEYGDAALWFVRDLPRHLKKALTDPKVITVAITVFALLADSLLFYPTTTWVVLKATIALIDITKYLWAVKLATYLISVESIIAMAARTLGRFGNEELMDKFYNNASQASAVSQ